MGPNVVAGARPWLHRANGPAAPGAWAPARARHQSGAPEWLGAGRARVQGRARLWWPHGLHLVGLLERAPS